MPRSWLSDDWFLPIMDIISWILAHGISFDSRSFSAHYGNENHYAYWVYAADTSHRSSDEAGTRVDSDSFTNIQYPLYVRPVDTWVI